MGETLYRRVMAYSIVTTSSDMPSMCVSLVVHEVGPGAESGSLV